MESLLNCRQASIIGGPLCFSNLSVSAWYNSDPTGWIVTEFDTVDFYGIVLNRSKFD